MTWQEHYQSLISHRNTDSGITMARREECFTGVQTHSTKNSFSIALSGKSKKRQIWRFLSSYIGRY